MKVAFVVSLPTLEILNKYFFYLLHISLMKLMFIQKKNHSLFANIVKRLQNIFLFDMFFPLNILPVL